MQYLLLLHADEAGWDAMEPAAQGAAMAGYGAFGEALSKARDFYDLVERFVRGA